MTFLLALGLYLFVGLVTAAAVATEYLEPDTAGAPPLRDRVIIILIAPWALLLAFAEGDDPVELWHEIIAIVFHSGRTDDDLEL